MDNISVTDVKLAEKSDTTDVEKGASGTSKVLGGLSLKWTTNPQTSKVLESLRLKRTSIVVLVLPMIMVGSSFCILLSSGEIAEEIQTRTKYACITDPQLDNGYVEFYCNESVVTGNDTLVPHNGTLIPTNDTAVISTTYMMFYVDYDRVFVKLPEYKGNGDSVDSVIKSYTICSYPKSKSVFDSFPTPPNVFYRRDIYDSFAILSPINHQDYAELSIDFIITFIFGSVLFSTIILLIFVLCIPYGEYEYQNGPQYLLTALGLMTMFFAIISLMFTFPVLSIAACSTPKTVYVVWITIDIIIICLCCLMLCPLIAAGN